MDPQSNRLRALRGAPDSWPHPDTMRLHVSAVVILALVAGLTAAQFAHAFPAGQAEPEPFAVPGAQDAASAGPPMIRLERREVVQAEDPRWWAIFAYIRILHEKLSDAKRCFLYGSFVLEYNPTAGVFPYILGAMGQVNDTRTNEGATHNFLSNPKYFDQMRMCHLFKSKTPCSGNYGCPIMEKAPGWW
ncbi:hypothetical protein DFJ74DRAFT_654916 [Hyaloraphidium curvatum]|nr:hypothetical protein DFJ74DRAFT_654916 [Hyaloraphidium curvatum]